MLGRLTALSVTLALAACNGQSGDTHGPQSTATQPPGAAFREGLMYAAVKARLAGMDIDSTTRISVRVAGGEVTLSGTVADDRTRARDVKLIRDMRGVTSVNDELRVGRVGRSAAQAVGDAALTAAVASALTAQTGVNVAGVKIHAAGGTVTLAGHAPTAAIRSTMLDAARKTPGVRNVVDRIGVR